MDEQVRRACPADAAELQRLESQARDGLAGQRGAARLLAELSPVGDWSQVVADPARAVLVATLDDLVVGYLELVVDRDVALVRQVYVEPGARELGFGDAMVEQAIAHARSSGCSAFEAFALPGDRETKNLYERAGVTARKIVVSLAL